MLTVATILRIEVEDGTWVSEQIRSEMVELK